MLITNTITDAIAKEMLLARDFQSKKDIVICTSIDPLPNYLLKKINMDYTIITVDDMFYDDNFSYLNYNYYNSLSQEEHNELFIELSQTNLIIHNCRSTKDILKAIQAVCEDAEEFEQVPNDIEDLSNELKLSIVLKNLSKTKGIRTVKISSKLKEVILENR